MALFYPIQQSFFFPSNSRMKELPFLDDFLLFLEESGVGEIIKCEIPIYKEGRRPYDPYKLFMDFPNIQEHFEKSKKASSMTSDLCIF